jgi:hypothetical protein
LSSSVRFAKPACLSFGASSLSKDSIPSKVRYVDGVGG